MAGEVQPRGGGKGVRLRLIETGAFSRALDRLSRRLAEGLPLTGKAVTIDAGRRRLGAQELQALESLVLEENGATLLQVVDGRQEAPAAVPEPETDVPTGPVPDRAPGVQAGPPRQPPKGDGLVLPAGDRTASVQAAPGLDAAAVGPRTVTWERSRRLAAEGQAAGPASGGAAQSRREGRHVDPPAEENTILIKRTLRSGQRVRHGGSVVVLGDVNPGAEVVAAGDIVVMGTLRGVAHAGAKGDDGAIVAAFRLQPTQLRIGAVIGRSPDGQEIRPDAPEVARVRDGAVVIERYVPSGSPDAGQARRTAPAADLA